MRIDGHNMPPLRGLNLFGTDFYKDVTPTALGNRRAFMTGEMVQLSHIR